MRKTELTLLFYALLAGLLLGGILSGFTSIGLLSGLAIASIAYALSCIVRLRKVFAWLRQDEEGEPPESIGEWGELLDELHRLRRGYAKRQSSLEDRIDNLQNSFASLDDAVVLLSNSDEIDWCNESADRLLGLLPQQDRGQVLQNLLRSPDFLSYFENGEYDKPLSMMSPVSDATELECHITHFGKGNRMLFVRDVTGVRRLEQTRTDFIANVSHELRTPLTVITGYLETMVDSDTEWQPALAQMSDQAKRMEDLLADLMQLNRLESVPEKAQHDELDLRSIVSMIFDETSVHKPQQKLELKVKTDARLLGSQQELYSAFANLIHNASKYTAGDGNIGVTWQLEASGASLSVSDTGAGIEAQHLSRLTERFYRADPSRHSLTGGTGLGLAIVKHVLLRHQADLSIESIPNKGSSFVCHFPEERIVRPEVDAGA